MSQIFYIKSVKILCKYIRIKILMIILDNVKACLLLIIMRYLFALDDISGSIDFLCVLIGKRSYTLVIKEKNSVIPWTVLSADRHICLLVHYPLKMIWNRSCITVSVVILKNDRCII